MNLRRPEPPRSDPPSALLMRAIGRVPSGWHAEHGRRSFRAVSTLYERFPETLTQEEACEMAGIDPRSFGIDEDALTGTDDERLTYSYHPHP